MNTKQSFTCKDCFNYELCRHTYYEDKNQTKIPYGFLEEINVDKKCAFFKNKETIAEFPCKVGTTAYIAHPFTSQIIKCKVTHFQYNGSIIAFFDNGYVLGVSDFGKYVFFTESDAENKLEKTK